MTTSKEPRMAQEVLIEQLTEELTDILFTLGTTSFFGPKAKQLTIDACDSIVSKINNLVAKVVDTKLEKLQNEMHKLNQDMLALQSLAQPKKIPGRPKKVEVTPSE